MKEKARNPNGSSQGNFQDLGGGENALLASNKFPKKCYYCGKSGHIKAFCDEWNKRK